MRCNDSHVLADSVEAREALIPSLGTGVFQRAGPRVGAFRKGYEHAGRRIRDLDPHRAALSVQPRARAISLNNDVLVDRDRVLQVDPPDTVIPGGRSSFTEVIPDADKTEGIPNYMLRTSGTIRRITDPGLEDDGVLYLEADRLVSIVTSDVIDMVQQQGGAAAKVDRLGETFLVEGLLFDDFKANSTFDVAPSDAGGDIVSLEVVEPRPATALELGQIGDDESARAGIASILGIQSGFAGWTARVVTAGRVQVRDSIAKRPAESDDE